MALCLFTLSAVLGDVLMFHSREVHAQSSLTVYVERVTPETNGVPAALSQGQRVPGTNIVGFACNQDGCFVASR